MSNSPSSGYMTADTVNSLYDTDVDTHPDVIYDEYKNLEEVTEAIRKQGLESCHMIFGIDYTVSNNRTGEKTFGGKCLHAMKETGLNPYQKVICIFGETLEPFNRGENIPVFGFGDSKCKDKSIFELKPGYHILIIATDGQIPDEKPTAKAIIEASEYPLSIIVVGVGDGPWDTMKRFDDQLPARKFDNFQFVNFHEVMNDRTNPEAAFALHALMEIPKQYQYLKREGLIE